KVRSAGAKLGNARACRGIPPCRRRAAASPTAVAANAPANAISRHVGRSVKRGDIRRAQIGAVSQGACLVSWIVATVPCLKPRALPKRRPILLQPGARGFVPGAALRCAISGPKCPIGRTATREGRRMGHRYQSILETVGNTPVVRVNNLAPAGIDLYVKIEAFNPLGSVKDRLALGVIEAAEKSGELKPGQTVIEATSGNTGIGLAMVCAAKGYPLVVTMAETFSVERRKLMRFLGTKVVLTRPPKRELAMVKKPMELIKPHGCFLTRQFENEANPDMHSRTTAREIIDDFKGERLDYWVTGFGTGGTLKGVARVLAKERP